MTKKDEKLYRTTNFRRVCGENIESDKDRDHCHLTGFYRGPAHNKCKNIVTQKQSNFLPFVFQNFGNHDCHLFVKKLVEKTNDEVKFDLILQTNEE